MLQKVIVALVSSAFVLGSFGPVSAAPGAKTESAQPARNAAPLAPGRAAGIRQAQGATTNDWILIGGGVLLAAGILILVGAGNGDDSSPTTGSN